MKNKIGLLLFLLLGFSLVGQSAYALPYLANGTNKIFYNNYEAVFRNDGGVYKELPQGPTSGPLQQGDIFVGIIDIQDIKDINNQILWDNPNGDQLTGIFAQEITGFTINPSGGFTVDVKPTAVTTFNPIVGPSFSTGLAANEMFEIYLDAGGSTPFTTGGSIASGVAAATDGVSWLTLGDADSPVIPGTTFNTPGEEYAWSAITSNFLDPYVDFAGDQFIGMSILDYAGNINLIGDPLLNDPTENRFDSDVQFYANSELTINPDYAGIGGTQYWAYESNDPARMNAAIPEPTTMLLMGVGLLGISAIGRKRKLS